MTDDGEDWGADCDFCGAPDRALCHCEGQRLRARVAELEALQAHRNHSPCAIRILREFYSDEEAHGIAMEFTCFPMDCDMASKQAVEFLVKSKVTETGETTGEKRVQRFLAETSRADLPEGAAVELCTPDTTQNAHDWGLWWWSLGEAHGGGWDGYASSEADALWTAFHMNDALTKEKR